MKYTLPEVLRNNKYKENNILRLCNPVESIEFDIVKEKPFIVKSSFGDKYLLTNDKNDTLKDSYQNVLLIKELPTKEKLISGKIEFISWIKHTKLKDIKPDEVLKTWKNSFKFIKEDSSLGIKGLRPPQISALYSILSHLISPKERGVVVMPTGTGKTETMLSTLIANESKKVLVVVPSDSLRTQISNKFITLGILKEFGLVDQNVLTPNVGVIKSWFDDSNTLKDFINDSNVVVTTMDIFRSRTPAEIKIINNSFSHLFVDEAHHSEAKSWSKFIESFDNAKVLLFTATPFRNDGKKIKGKFIYKFSLKEAQEQGYYKKINFQPIREYDQNLSDQKISELAVNQLKEDLESEYEHILMARCNSIRRAKEVFQYYEKYNELSPVLVYSSLPNKNQVIENIKKCKHKIIVCVNMLGEGFDLPELKIAAVHDERQSIPVTLQFIGRFTRTSSKKIGDATFVTNIAYPPLQKELELLYEMDADWNLLLSYIGDGIIDERVEFKVFLESFKDLSNVPVESIQPAFSAVMYKFTDSTWHPKNWNLGFTNINSYDNIISDYSSDEKVLVILLGKLNQNDWGGTEEFVTINWDIILIHWDSEEEMIYLNTSLSSLNEQKLLEAIFGSDIEKFQGEQMFKVFHDISMLRLNNLGARKINGKDISFQNFFGSGVQDGLSVIDQKKYIKNNTFGIGFRKGDKMSIGTTVKGKVWSFLRGDILDWIKWCKRISRFLNDSSIDHNTVFEHTIQPVKIKQLPEEKIIAIDFNPKFYVVLDRTVVFSNSGLRYDLSNIELLLEEQTDKDVLFSLLLGSHTIKLKFSLISKDVFDISLLSSDNVEVSIGSRYNQTIVNFFKEYPPLFMFSENSNLLGNFYSKVTEDVLELPKDNVIGMNWTGVDITKEAQGVYPQYIEDSIQYHFINKVKDDYDFVFDDDGAGEIADVIGIQQTENQFTIDLFHLKYSGDNKVGKRLSDFYEVCGQAQKSLRWKYKDGKDFYDRLLKREERKKKKNSIECTRIIKGDLLTLEKYLKLSKRGKKIKFNINIVQPGVSEKDISPSILTLLGNTAHYLKSMGNVEMKLYCNE